MGAGLIYAGIVAVWAIVLAPMWIRRTDDRFDPLMAARTSPGIRVLTRRPRTPTMSARHTRPTTPPATARSARYGVAPARVRASGPRAVRAQGRSLPEPPRRLAGRSSTVARRRRFLASLAVASVGLFVGVLFAAAPVWAPALPVIMLVGYLARVRGEARRAYERKRRERVVVRRRAEARRRAELQVAALPPISTDVGRPALMNPDGTWQPVRIPLPTYVTAPVAARGDGRPIVLGTYGSWTQRRMGDLMRRDRTSGGRPLVVGQSEHAERDGAMGVDKHAVNE